MKKQTMSLDELKTNILQEIQEHHDALMTNAETIRIYKTTARKGTLTVEDILNRCVQEYFSQLIMEAQIQETG